MRRLTSPLYLVVPISLLLLTSISCGSDPASPEEGDDEPEVELTVELAAEALVEYLVEEGFIPQEGVVGEYGIDVAPESINDSITTTHGDYFEVVVLDDEETYVRGYLDEYGHLIPHSRWRSENPEYCSDLGLEMRTPAMIVDAGPISEATYEGDGYYSVDVYFKDYHTHDVISEMSAYFRATLGSDGNVSVYFHDEWSRDVIEALQPTEGPCKSNGDSGNGDDDDNGEEEESDLIVRFDSQIDAEYQSEEADVYLSSTVEAEIGVAFDEETGTYAGEGVLSHRNYEGDFTEWGCTAEPEDGIIAVEFDGPEVDASSDGFDFYLTEPTQGTDAPSVALDCDGFDPDDLFDDLAFEFAIWFPTFVLLHEEHIDDERKDFHFEGWKESDEAGVIAVKEFEQSADLTDWDPDYDGNISIPVEEATVIEIHTPDP